MRILIGVLALQGAFSKHIQMLQKIGASTIEVRTQDDLDRVDGLILPGGESTVMNRLIQDSSLLYPLQLFAKHHPVFGTCAGMILLSSQGICPLFDITVERNAYGRQIDSFSVPIELYSPLSNTFTATFIRAPIIREIHSTHVDVLAHHESNPVLVQQGLHLAASFHPELTNDPQIHQYFLERVRHAKQSKKRSLYSY